MHLIFVLLYFVFFFSVFLRRRSFDFLTVYAIFLTLYNIPTLFGFVLDPFSGRYEAAGDELYAASSIIFFLSLPFYYLKNNYGKTPINDCSKSLVRFVLFFLMIIYLFILVVYLPQVLAVESKKDLLESGSNLYSYFGMIPVLGFFIALKARRGFYAFVFLLFVILMMALGTRRPFAIFFVGTFLVIFAGRVINPKNYVAMFCLGFSGLLVSVLAKTFYGSVLRYGLEGVSIWVSNFNASYFLVGSEFLSRSSILSSVIINDFSTDTIHILKSLLAILPIPLSVFGYSSSAFNDQFQPILFAGLDYGMAYNPWAEAYSWLGYWGIAIYAIIICSSLSLLWRAYCRLDILWSSLILLIAMLVAFWIHRNSLGSELAYIRNALYPSVIIYFLAGLFYSVLSRINRQGAL